MKRSALKAAIALFGLAALGLVFSSAGGTQTQRRLVPVTLQLKWFPQAQFAGYFVAQSKGYFAAEGLEVKLLPSGDANPVRAVQSGAADFGTTWITDLLTQRAKGTKVVHIAQMFQRSGFTLVMLKDSNLTKIADLKGKRIGVWPGGNEYPAVAVLAKYKLTSSLDSSVASPDVTAVTYPFDPALVFPDKVDAVSAMTYNEVNQIVGLGYPLDRLRVINLADEGVNLLEDLMFSMEGTLAAANFKSSGLSGREVAARLLRASLKGWDYAVKNQAEAVNIVLPLCGNTCKGSGKIDARAHQTWQMREIAKLYNAGPTLRGLAGYLEPAAYRASVKLLRDQNILTADPDAGAVNYAVWEAATGKKAAR